MKKFLFIFLIYICGDAYGCNDLLDTDVKILNKKEYKNLCEYSDKTILVVNTASKCGYTYQYEELEALHRRFSDEGFTVLGFPSRNFLWQEYSDEAKVGEFCKAMYDVTFPMFSISDVKSSTKHPFFRKIYQLTDERPSWNFHKFLITKNGKIKSFSHKIEPNDPKIIKAIQDSINL
tara:strand:+ start:9611 stop:10141 length:531 start_codon:yes stop_codon:yes gene_type:complete